MSCTIVTAYYEIKSKFDIDTYMIWGKRFLSLSSPIVLFTEEHLVDNIKKMRGDKPIHIVTIPFKDLDTWKLYKDNWMKNHEIDPEKHYHSPQLYAIWAQKAFFVEKAIEMDAFKTEYFFWCDFGAFREDKSEKVMNLFPLTNYFIGDKLLLQSIRKSESSDRIVQPDGIIGEPLHMKCRIVGGLWGGSKKACLQWRIKYQEMLEKYFKAGRFAGKDQTVMLSTYYENHYIAIVVNSTRCDSYDDWFFLQHLLSDDASFQIDDSYNF
jgi:hypothetical protein